MKKFYLSAASNANVEKAVKTFLKYHDYLLDDEEDYSYDDMASIFAEEYDGDEIPIPSRILDSDGGTVVDEDGLYNYLYKISYPVFKKLVS